MKHVQRSEAIQNKTEKHDETCKTMVQKESELFDTSIKTMKGTKDKQKIT